MTTPLVRPDARYLEATRLGIEALVGGLPLGQKANSYGQLAAHTAACTTYLFDKALEFAAERSDGAQAALDLEDLKIKLLYLRPVEPLETQPAYDGFVMDAVTRAAEHLAGLSNGAWPIESVTEAPLIRQFFWYLFAAQIQNPEILDVAARWLASRFVVTAG